MMLPMKNDLHYSEVSALIRCYRDGQCFEDRDDYVAVVSVLWQSATSVLIFGAHGDMTREQGLRMLKMLYDKGAETVELKRANGRKVPYFKKISEGAQETLWRVDLKSLFAQ